MSIPETISFDKDGEALGGGPGRELFRKLFITLVILLTALLSFGVGVLTGSRESQEGNGVSIKIDSSLVSAPLTTPTTQTASVSSSLTTPTAAGAVVASKNGSKYHYPHCPGAKQIKEANKITFATPQAAEAAGYTLAANCKGP